MKNGKNRRQILILAGVILPGIIISILGLYYVSQQKASRELNLRQDYEKKITDIRDRIESEAVNMIRNIYPAFNTSGLDLKDPSSVLETVKSVVVANPIVNHPLILDSQNNFIFPISAAKGKKPLRNRDRALSDPFAGSLYRKARELEFSTKDLLTAIKIYVKCLNRSTSGTPYILNAIGRSYFKDNKYHQALSYYRKLKENYNKELLNDRPLLFTVIRQEALTLRKLELQAEAVKQYLKLYELITKFEARSGTGQFELYKNEALDQLSRFRRTKRGRTETDRLTENFPELENMTPLDRLLDWRFTEPENIDGQIKNPGSRSLDNNYIQLSELYTPSDEKTLFYRSVRGMIRKGKEAEGIRIVPFHFFPLNRKVTISYKKSGSRDGSKQYTSGFMVNDETILNIIAPKYLTGAVPDKIADVRIEYDQNLSLSAQNTREEFLLLSSPFDNVLNGYSVKIYSKNKHLFRALANREVIINYGLILSLVLVLILGTILFQKYIMRESKLLQSKAEFIDRVSHTLKTPLTRMRLLSENISAGWIKDEKKREEFLKNIISETGRMNDTINNMLNFSQIDSGKKFYKFQTVSVKDLIEEYLRINSEEFSGYHPGIRTELPDDLPLINGDPDGIRLIISNLVQNSIKYSPEEKDILIKLGTENGRVKLTVKDNGAGISREDQKHIFEKFFRSGQTNISAIEGSGLGLFIVTHIAEAHNAEIKLNSSPGEGTVITITFPPAGTET